MKQTLVSLSFLKQKARQLKKAKSLSQHEALDEAAKFFGFSNYRNFLNALDANRNQPKPATDQQIHALWLEKKSVMATRLAAVEPRFKQIDVQLEKLIADLQQVRTSKLTVQSLCEKSKLKEFLELYFFEEALQDDDGELDDLHQYHIPKSVVLKNLAFKFKDQNIRVEGEYDMVLEFAFEHDKDDKHPVFEDEELFGSFELSIDKSGTVSIEEHDISVSW